MATAHDVLSQPRIGPALRRIREEVGISVRTLALKTGFSPSFISQVETEQASPSIASLGKITAELGISLGQLFHSLAPEVALVRVPDRTDIRSGWSKATLTALTRSGAGRTEAVLTTFEPGGSSGKRKYPAKREEFIFMLSGSLRLELGDKLYDLTRGDAVTIAVNVPYRLQNRSARPSELLIVRTA